MQENSYTSPLTIEDDEKSDKQGTSKMNSVININDEHDEEEHVIYFQIVFLLL